MSSAAHASQTPLPPRGRPRWVRIAACVAGIAIAAAALLTWQIERQWKHATRQLDAQSCGVIIASAIVDELRTSPAPWLPGSWEQVLSLGDVAAMAQADPTFGDRARAALELDFSLAAHPCRIATSPSTKFMVSRAEPLGQFDLATNDVILAAMMDRCVRGGR